MNQPSNNHGRNGTIGASRADSAPPDLEPEHRDYLAQADRDLLARIRAEVRRQQHETRQAQKAGHSGALEVTLTVPRKHWPAAHQAALDARAPIRTYRNTNGERDVTLTTTRSGAAALQAVITTTPLPRDRLDAALAAAHAALRASP